MLPTCPYCGSDGDVCSCVGEELHDDERGIVVVQAICAKEGRNATS